MKGARAVGICEYIPELRTETHGKNVIFAWLE